MSWARLFLDAWAHLCRNVAGACLTSTPSEAKLAAALPSVQCRCPQCYACSPGTTKSRWRTKCWRPVDVYPAAKSATFDMRSGAQNLDQQGSISTVINTVFL